jgi:hypothetical protein
VATGSAEGFRDGDIVVTAVADHYSIGRVGPSGIEEYLASARDRPSAEALACRFAGGTHRVFVRKNAGQSQFASIDCEEITNR